MAKSRYFVQERGQPWPIVIGPIGFWMNVWYVLLVRPWFKLHQRRHPWRWQIWDAETNDWVRHPPGKYAWSGQVHTFEYANAAYDERNRLEYRD